MSRARAWFGFFALSLIAMAGANAQSLRESGNLRLAEHSRGTQQTIDTLQARLVALAPLGYSGDAQREFRFASANAWLVFAFDARAQRDNATSKAAFSQATHLIERMEAEDFGSDSRAPGIGIDEPVAKERLAEIDAMKHDDRLRCAPAHVAKLEVATLQAAHAHRLLGRRHARPYWLAADELAAQIAPRLQHCKVPR
jgi:hypothetical protein